jgi:RmlD substrate binding domain
VRLGVVRLALIAVGGEEPADPRLSLGAAVVHDVDGRHGVPLDAHADLLARLADDGADHVLARFELFTDDVKTPVHVADLAAASLELCTSNVTGVVHVAGTDAVSRYELGCLIAARDGLDPAALPTGSSAAAGMKPSVVRLDVTRATGFLSTRLRGAREFTATGLA